MRAYTQAHKYAQHKHTHVLAGEHADTLAHGHIYIHARAERVLAHANTYTHTRNSMNAHISTHTRDIPLNAESLTIIPHR